MKVPKYREGERGWDPSLNKHEGSSAAIKNRKSTASKKKEGK
jgi:hypothetical protein